MSDEAGGNDGRGGEQTDEAGGRPCPVCGEPMYHRHCKYVCPNHGVIMDCSDIFYG